MTHEELEEQGRQMIMNQSLYRILEDNGGSIELDFNRVMNSKDMGGISIEIRSNGKLLLSALEPQTCEAFKELINDSDTTRN